MHEHSSDQNAYEIEELLRHYEELRAGRNASFLDEESFEIIIDYFDEKDEFSKALEATDTALSYYPYSAQLLIKKADLLIATHHYAEALEILKQAESFDASDIDIYILKTDAYLALDMQGEAARLLEEALLFFEGDEKVDLLFELTDVYDDYEDFEKVFDCLKLILEQEPTNEEALYKICFWTDFTGRNEESIRLHQSLIDQHPYSELAWFNLGSAYQGLKLYEKAIDAYQYAVVINEKFDYAYRNMGDAYIRLRKYKEAIEVLEKVCEITRPEEVIFEAIGHCYHRIGKYAQARFNYRKASHINPTDSKLYYKIALTYINEELWESAVKQLENALRIHRNVPEYNLAMGQCAMKLENYKDAVHYFSLVVRSRPKNVKGWEALIQCLFEASYFEEALQQCKAAIKMTEGKPVFYFLYSAVLFAAGKSKEGLVQLEHGLKEAPSQVKKFVEFNPSILQNSQVVDMIARYRKPKRNR
ncbi:MAG TPA: tetratricopeptide repeat protein [Parafilimonas sp.]|nr:tetratricopeptide repeat protein [Parafilimonas sp.]